MKNRTKLSPKYKSDTPRSASEKSQNQSSSNPSDTAHLTDKASAICREIVRFANIIAIELDDQGRVLWLNDYGLEFLGYREDEIRGKSIIGTIFPDDESSVGNLKALLETIYKNPPECITTENEIKKKNGERVWISWANRAFCNEKGEVASLVAVGSDLTELKKAEAALRESEKCLEAVFNANLAANIMVNKNGTVLYANPETARRLNTDVDNLRGRSIYDFLPPEVAQRRRRYVEEVCRLKRPVHFEDTRSGRIISQQIYPVLDSDGEVSRVAIYGEDITDLKKSEEALRKQADLLSSIRKAQSLYIAYHQTEEVFDQLLHILVEATQSEYGFLDEVLYNSAGTPYKLSLALSDISWDEGSRKLYQELVSRNRVFDNLNNLSGAPVLEGQVIIANDVANDPRSGGLPEGHPVISCFMGIPIFYDKEIVGVAGVANRLGGYSQQDAEFIEPLISACSNMIYAQKIRRREQEVAEALRLSEEKNRRIVETANEGIWTMDGEFRTTYVNHRMAEMLGYQPEEMLGRRVDSFMIPEDLSDHAAQMAFRKQGKDSVYERCFQRKDGTILWTNVSATSLQDEQGHFAGSFAMFTDITDRKNAEEALKRSEWEKSLILNATREMFTHYTPDLKVLWANKAAADSVWQTIDQLKGRFCYEIWHNRSEPCTDCPVLRAKETGVPQEAEVTTPDGRSWYLRGYPIKDEKGAVVSLVEFGQEITERKRVEEALKESEERFRSLIENLGDAVFAHDLEGRLVMVNRAACEQVGYSREELLNLTAADIDAESVSRDDRTKYWLRLTPNCQVSFEVVHRRKDGSKYPAEVTLNRVDMRDNPVIIALARDITERKQAEEERLEMERRLLHAQKLESLGVLAGGIAHDFNNLLMAVLGNLNLALADLSPMSPTRFCLEQAMAAARRAADLTRQMLAYSGKGRFVIKDIHLSELVEENAHMLKAALSKSVILQMNLKREIPPVRADAGQIQQVVMNLITNASEAIGENTGVVTLNTGIRTYTEDDLLRSRQEEKPPAGEFVYLEVSDTGCGMDAETLQRLFDPFYTTKFTGRGLGMSAVLGIVRGHKGAIFVDSEIGKGSTITVLFPMSESSAVHHVSEQAFSEKENRLQAEGTKSKGTVLIVDDEELIRSVCKRIVEHGGYRTLSAGDGEEAVAIFREHAGEIRCVILDLTMPRKDGVTTYGELRQIRPDVQVLLSSGYTEMEATRRFIGQGLAGFIQKPYRPQELISLLEQVIRTQSHPQSPAIS